MHREQIFSHLVNKENKIYKNWQRLQLPETNVDQKPGKGTGLFSATCIEGTNVTAGGRARQQMTQVGQVIVNFRSLCAGLVKKWDK
jgi:hypothetical protein